MSNQRFPRTKYVRNLIRLEDELEAWIILFEQQALLPRPLGEREALEAKARELNVLREDLHDIADQMAQMPGRLRDSVKWAGKRSRE